MTNGKARLLEHGANVLTIVTCIFACWLLWQMYQQGGLAGVALESASGTVEAELVDLPGYDFRRPGVTIVVALSSTCRYCTENLPFVKALSQSPVVADHQIPIVAIGVETEDSLLTYLNYHGVAVERVYSMRSRPLLLRQTPSLAIVNSSGQITRIWWGVLTKQRVDDIVSALEESV